MVGFLAGLLSVSLVMGAVLMVAAGALHILGLLVTGVVVAALGRLADLGRASEAVAPAAGLLVGIGGSMLGGFMGWFLFVGNRPLSLLSSSAGAASILWLVHRQPA